METRSRARCAAEGLDSCAATVPKSLLAAIWQDLPAWRLCRLLAGEAVRQLEPGGDAVDGVAVQFAGVESHPIWAAG